VLSDALDPSWLRWDAFVVEGARAKRGRAADGEIAFAQLPFDWPLWILFSSVRHHLISSALLGHDRPPEVR
jgi:hypothetical protein